jgi:hypothetical protein
MSVPQKIIYCFGLLGIISTLLVVGGLSCGVLSDNEELILSGVRDNIHSLQLELQILNTNLTNLKTMGTDLQNKGDTYYLDLSIKVASLRLELRNISQNFNLLTNEFNPTNNSSMLNQFSYYILEIEELNNNIEKLRESYGNIDALTDFLEKNQEALNEIAAFLAQLSND